MSLEFYSLTFILFYHAMTLPPAARVPIVRLAVYIAEENDQ